MKVVFADGSSEQYEDTSLGRGTQGEVYRSHDGRSVVKLYTLQPEYDASHRARLETLIEKHNPTRIDPYWQQFLAWPEKLVVAPLTGFRMPYIPHMKAVAHYLYSRAYKKLSLEEKGWFIGRIAAAIQLVNVASLIARMGLCYPDFSDRNIVVDPFSGHMVLIDCDSIMHKDRPDILAATVQGTSSFRAPELITGMVRYPSVITDRHTLAVLLYRWLLGVHPLLGDNFHSLDAEEDEKLALGSQALYIEHPHDPSNRASEQTIKASMLSPELERCFQVAFVEGIHEPEKRPLPFQWLDALRYTYDRLIPCSNKICQWHFFVASPAPKLICPNCQQALTYPHQLPLMYLLKHGSSRHADDFNRDTSKAHYVVGWPGRPLHQWHVKATASPLQSVPLSDLSEAAVFELDPQTNTRYLKNMALPELRYSSGDGHRLNWNSCPLNYCIPLSHKMLLQFGNTADHFQAEIHLDTTKSGPVVRDKRVFALPGAQKTEPWPTLHVPDASRRSISSGKMPEATLGITGIALPALSLSKTKRRFEAL